MLNEAVEINLEIDTEKLKTAVEAMLFLSEKPLSLDDISKLLEVSREDTAVIIEKLQAEYETRGIQITHLAGHYQMTTNPKIADFIKKMKLLILKPLLSTAALEVLSIIAYLQPITRGQAESIRGVNSDNIIRQLIEKKLVIITGFADVPGKPKTLGTTPEFLRYFGLGHINDMPPIELGELKENFALQEKEAEQLLLEIE